MIEPQDRAAWLPAWMAEQIETGVAQRVALSAVGEEAMYLFASVDVDTVLTLTGAVYVGEYDIETLDSAGPSIRWRQVESVERLGWIVIGARRFTQLRALLPERSPSATACASCRGSGDWHVFSQDRKESLRIRGMICWTCGGLGWRPLAP